MSLTKLEFLRFNIIPIILVAPAALHPITAESPTPPSPHTAVLDPGSTLRDK